MASKSFPMNVLRLQASDDRKLFLAETKDGDIYLFDIGLKQQLRIDKTYQIDHSFISPDNKTLFLVARNTPFYLFDLTRKDYLFSGTGYSNVVPLPQYGSFVSWPSDENVIDIIHPSDNTFTVRTDTSILHVLPSLSNDSIIIFTLSSYFILSRTGKLLLKKPFVAYSLQQGATLLPSGTFVIYYDSLVRVVSPDLKHNVIRKLNGRVRHVIATPDNDFIVLLSNGEVAAYNPTFACRWKFADQRLAVSFIDDKIYYAPPRIYKVNTAGEFFCFDTAGNYKGAGTLTKGTSWPGGYFFINFSMNAYLFSPPDRYLSSSNATYEHNLYDITGKRIFTYRFVKPYFGQILNEDKVLFQGSGKGELFTQFTPSGGLKKFAATRIKVSFPDKY